MQGSHHIHSKVLQNGTLMHYLEAYGRDVSRTGASESVLISGQPSMTILICAEIRLAT